jgi:hypothetical protein
LACRFDTTQQHEGIFGVRGVANIIAKIELSAKEQLSRVVHIESSMKERMGLVLVAFSFRAGSITLGLLGL